MRVLVRGDVSSTTAVEHRAWQSHAVAQRRHHPRRCPRRRSPRQTLGDRQEHPGRGLPRRLGAARSIRGPIRNKRMLELQRLLEVSSQRAHARDHSSPRRPHRGCCRPRPLRIEPNRYVEVGDRPVAIASQEGVPGAVAVGVGIKWVPRDQAVVPSLPVGDWGPNIEGLPIPLISKPKKHIMLSSTAAG